MGGEGEERVGIWVLWVGPTGKASSEAACGARSQPIWPLSWASMVQGRSRRHRPPVAGVGELDERVLCEVSQTVTDFAGRLCGDRPGDNKAMGHGLHDV